MWTTDKQPVCGVAATVVGGASVVVDVLGVLVLVLVLELVVVVVLVLVLVAVVVVVGAVDVVVVDEVDVVVVGGVVDVPTTLVDAAVTSAGAEEAVDRGKLCGESLQLISAPTATPSSDQPPRDRMSPDTMAGEPSRHGHANEPPGRSSATSSTATTQTVRTPRRRRRTVAQRP
jgi:hypothetical protein